MGTFKLTTVFLLFATVRLNICLHLNALTIVTEYRILGLLDAMSQYNLTLAL